MYDEKHFTRDAAIASFDGEADGITVDDDGEPTIDWDEVETVTIDNPPHANAFDSKKFYKLPATVAKPIPQPYQYGEDAVWLKKPREELKKAAWSLDNASWTLGHPDTGMVKSVDDVRGFWKNPRYIDSTDDLDADLHIPVNDDEAMEFVEENGDVSVGFYNRISRIDEYDGVVGGSDDDDVEVEGYQTDMLFDHCASVVRGRCSSEAGCGIDAANHGQIDSSFKSGTIPMNTSEDADGTVSMQETTDSPSGIYEADSMWFAVGPDEHPDESTEWAGDAKFPVDSCSDIQDAWNLRGTGDISIEKSTLEERIKRAAEAKDCDLNTDSSMADAAESAKRYSVCGARKGVMDMESRDCGCDGDNEEDNNDTNMEINFDDLSVEAALAKVEAQHDGAAERLEELRAAQDEAEAAQEAADELDLESTDDLADKVGLLKEKNDKLRDEIDKLQRPQMEEDAEYIAEHTDRFGDDAEAVMEELDEDPEEVADKRELVEELASGYDEQTANSGGSNEDTKTTTDGKYAQTPWE